MTLIRNLALLACTAFLTHGATAAPEEGVVSRIRRDAVASSNVASIGYSPHLHALEIEFTRGAIYRFLEVPRSVYRELMDSGSKGHFIAEHLRGRYSYVRVRVAKKAPSRSPLNRSQ